MPAPPITVSCECGELRHVPFGDRWTCEVCGRTWDTNQIPAEEFAQLIREQRRARLVPLGVAAGIFVVFGALAIFVSEALFLLAPAVVAGWLLWFMPLWRRRLRKRARELPRWQLTPE